jgi:transposase
MDRGDQMSQSSWLVAGIVPGVRQPLKKLAIDELTLLKLLGRCWAEAERKGHRITRIAVAFETGHDGFWLARLQPRHSCASSVAATREHHRAKTDRLDTGLLKRGFLGWLRGERGHCKMVAVPTLAEADAKRPSRERETLVGEASRIITRIKAAFVRLGIRSFNPKLKTAAACLEALRTPEGEPIPQRAAVLGSIKARPANDGACGPGRAAAGLDGPCARRPATRAGRREETGFKVEQRNRERRKSA